MAPNRIENIAAVILAAGLSERMAAFKPLLKLGSKAALQHGIDLFRSVGIGNILAVTGHRQEEISNVLAASDVVQVHNPSYRDGMFSSISAGIKALKDSCEAFFILPVDIPLVRSATIRRLLTDFFRFHPAICYPMFDNLRGHPPIISTELIPRILDWQGSGGLAGFLRQIETRALDVAVADQAILQDMDTPADYLCLRKRAARHAVPTEKECRALLEICNTPEAVQAHCKMVARVAHSLGAALTQTGLALDLELLQAAAGLHDLARGLPDHAAMGAQILRQWGFEELAPLVAQHMDLDIAPEGSLDECRVLYLADKLVTEDRITDLDLRFQLKLDQHGHNQKAADRISGRWRTADAIRTKIESTVGLPLERILMSLFQSP